MTEAITPYAGTSGFSGSQTSEDRARGEDASGVTAARQRETLRIANIVRGGGLTVKELRGFTQWHHGQASSVLSVMHKAGVLSRLTESRDRCRVYVLPEYVGGRDAEPAGRKRTPDPEATYEAFEAGFRLGWEDTTDFPDSSVRILFDKWMEQQ